MRDLLLAVRLVLGGWTLILASPLIAAGLTLAGLLVWRLWRGHREEVAYDDEMADYVDDQQTAVGRVAVPQPSWQVRDARQLQMLREGYVLLPEDLRDCGMADETYVGEMDNQLRYRPHTYRWADGTPVTEPGISQYPPYVPQQRDGGGRS